MAAQPRYDHRELGVRRGDEPAMAILVTVALSVKPLVEPMQSPRRELWPTIALGAVPAASDAEIVETVRSAVHGHLSFPSRVTNRVGEGREASAQLSS